MTAVLIADDIAAEREPVLRAVSMISGVDRICTATSGEEAIMRVRSVKPDVVLMDVRMPGMGGVAAARAIAQNFPETAVVMLTNAVDPESVGRAIEAGARGYVVKSAGYEEIVAVLAMVLGSRMATQTRPAKLTGTQPMLSAREREVLAGLAAGKSNAQIGESMFLSEDTVKTHARRLYRKLGAADRAQAVANGLRWGLLD
jgi:DNA-binding NarL/FixJ family response regulator